MANDKTADSKGRQIKHIVTSESEDGTGATHSLLSDTSGNLKVVGAAGTSLLGKVGIDQTTPGTTNGVQVVAALPTGTNRIGTVSGTQVTISVTKAVAAAGNYDAEDVISEHATTGTSWLFAAIARANGASGLIIKAQLICETTALTPRCTLFLFTAAPTSMLNDNVANTALLHADLANYVGKIDFPAMEDLGGDSEAVATPSTTGNLPLSFTCAAGADDLYGVLVTRDAITGETATDDWVIRLTAEQY